MYRSKDIQEYFIQMIHYTVYPIQITDKDKLGNTHLFYKILFLIGKPLFGSLFLLDLVTKTLLRRLILVAFFEGRQFGVPPF